MTSEMLSGPDLGAGYLHQLTTDRDGDRTTFTYHAQDGGQDANGPPKGPLDVFGFVHPPSPCPFGGPRCWHRRFLLPFSETPRVRPCYNRQRFVLQAMIDQVYAAAPVAVEPTVAEIIARLSAASLTSEDWYFEGAAGAWLLGAPLALRDIDMFVRRPAIERVGEALREYLIEPVATTDWPGLGIVRGARAFVGTFVAGARVGWAMPLEAPATTPDRPAMVEASFRGRTLRIPRPEYAVARIASRGPTNQLASLAEWLRAYGADGPLLESLLTQYSVRAAEARVARAALRA
jgi:hypothetical protein